ncbi:MAG: hypothetical protein CL477_00960 [Acidobacteria bacterium]|nr:hypothetical protein [Acidobacteriota bacterium]HJN43494.1 GIY-YIG nuclease family protein [Vicinamibacterales bacterium]
MGMQHGTYALILSCSMHAVVQIGRLGCVQLQSGYYVYVGSAFGPGGIAARLAHHVKVTPRPHWHVDYLRAHAVLEEVWYTDDPVRREHAWAALFAQARGASIPLVGFGSSDCRCVSHLWRFQTRPSRSSFQRRLRRHAMAAMTHLTLT